MYEAAECICPMIYWLRTGCVQVIRRCNLTDLRTNPLVSYIWRICFPVSLWAHYSMTSLFSRVPTQQQTQQTSATQLNQSDISERLRGCKWKSIADCHLLAGALPVVLTGEVRSLNASDLVVPIHRWPSHLISMATTFTADVSRSSTQC